MSRRQNAFILVILLMVSVVQESSGQSGTQENDSLRTYRLSEIVIGDQTERSRSLEAVRRISIASIVRSDASAASALVRLIPSAHLQTNSRGESLIYVRGAGERQVAVFFDGALLNIPWDYRVDMSLIPVGMLGGISVSRGVPSIVYGTNVIAGAVNLQSRSLDGPGSHVEIGGQVGSQATRMVQSTFMRKTSRWSAVASGSIYTTDGQALPSDANLDFNQRGSSVRTNTDREIRNLFLRIGHHFSSKSEIGISLLRIESEKGVAPEGHINPEIDRVRYWRYPSWNNTMLIVNAITNWSDTGNLHTTFWLGRFGQDIEQFAGIQYASLSDLQRDTDLTIGMRITGNRKVGPGKLQGAVNWLSSIHRQTDSANSEAATQTGRIARRFFRQMLYSTGAEYELLVGSESSFLLGVSLDGSATPKTGEKPPRDPDLAIGTTAGFRRNLGTRHVLRFSIGRKVRFPTMRELFGEALQRFELNPDLRAETSFQSELALERSTESVSGEIVAFYRRTFDTIDQEIVVVDGEKKRKRINLEGSRVWGMEVVGVAKLSGPLAAEGHISWMDPKGIVEGKELTLNEKPGLLATLTLLLSSRWGGTAQFSWVQTGAVESLSLDNTQVRLPASSMFNVRTSLRKYFSTTGVFLELYLGVSNLTDEVSFYQLGLPGPGREIRGGASISF